MKHSRSIGYKGTYLGIKVSDNRFAQLFCYGASNTITKIYRTV